MPSTDRARHRRDYQKRALLQDFAYWLLHNGWSDVTIERADERFALRLTNMESIAQSVTGLHVRRLFV